MYIKEYEVNRSKLSKFRASCYGTLALKRVNVNLNI